MFMSGVASVVYILISIVFCSFRMDGGLIEGYVGGGTHA